MAKLRDLSSGWVSYEICRKDVAGEYTVTPFSSALAISGTVARQAVTKMRMVQDLGWPVSKRVLTDDHGHPLIVKKDDSIWLLKCKPSCWRLYFNVWKTKQENRIIYVYAVCKKTDAEDPGDATEARNVLDGLRRGECGITRFEFPPR